ncbi:MAG: GMC family oxidoreductase [Bacteroidetes bacterium]|nr:GMC family oxidoreductase [Bacteroidota bacterium]
MIVDSSALATDFHETADAVVVGSGAGGAPMAFALASAGMKVYLIEEGKQYDISGFKRNSWKVMRDMYRDSGTVLTLGVPSIPLPLGNALGGTTIINSGTCFRTPENVLSQWKKQSGLTGLEYSRLIPHFETVEKMLGISDATEETVGANNILFAEGAKKLGLHPKPLPRNAPGCKGAGLCVFGCPNGAKQSMEKSFIPAASQKGAAVITSARVEKILIENKKAKSVSGSFRDGNKNKRGIFRIDAPVIILSCGAIYTPYLLLKNKLANSSGQAGKNLHIHPAAKVVGLFKDKINSWSGIPQGYYVDDYAHEGIMFEGFFLPPTFLSFALPAFGMDLKKYMAGYCKMAGFGIMVTDTSRGKVTVGIDNAPMVFYSVNRADTEKIKKGIEIASRVYFAAGAEKILVPLLGFDEITSPEELKILHEAEIKPSQLELSAFHPMGTCRMGDNPKQSVVNSYLETHDVKGLYIADASVFPSSLGVNPQVTIMALSLWCAENIIKK